MFTLHATAKLLRSLKVDVVPPVVPTTRLGNWYANHLRGPRSPIVCVSERTYLPVVIKPCAASALPRALADALGTLLTTIGIPDALVEQERFAMAQAAWAKTESRSLLGVLNEQAFLATTLLEQDAPSLAELNRQLADNIVKSQFPIDLTRQAFGLEAAAPPTSRATSPMQPVDAVEQLVRDFATRAPVDAHVVGVPVQVLELVREGITQRGLVAVCERGGERHRISLADVVFDASQPEALLSASVRRQLGLPPHPSTNSARRHKVSALPLGTQLEFVVLAVKSSALRCRELGSCREVTLRTAVRDEVPGEIVAVRVTKQWTHAGHPYVSGEVTGSRFDVAQLALVPLALRAEGDWNPDEEYWGEPGDSLRKWVREIIARGPRPAFEMEQVLPGGGEDDWEWDPIGDSVELKRAGQRAEANALLQGLLAQDLRCLDAHAHLGNTAFDHSPEVALRHYLVGAELGAQALGADFSGVLPWGLVDNRPYLRCLHGLGLCQWRLGRHREAAAVFSRMLWLNPGDNQGARFNLEEVEQGRDWVPDVE